MSAARKVLVLEHPRNRVDQRPFLARYLLEAWQKQGVEILRASDPARLPAADTLFMHVDLSVLPSGYRNLSGRFAGAINADLVDIRKRTLSVNQVMPGDGYEGAVIIKSNLNHAGRPEQLAATPQGGLPLLAHRVRRKARKLWQQGIAHLPPSLRSPDILGKADYLILPAAHDVPRHWWTDDAVVIERFTPERHDGLYVLREYYFLGDAEWVGAETAATPIITKGKFRYDLVCPVPEELRRLRRQWKIDYGKIDFVLQDGKPVVFDVNKTPSFTRGPRLQSSFELIDALTKGLASFQV